MVTLGDGKRMIAINGNVAKSEQHARDYYQVGHMPRIDDHNISDYVTTHEFGHLIFSPTIHNANAERSPIAEAFDSFFKSPEFKEHKKLEREYNNLGKSEKEVEFRNKIIDEHSKGMISTDDANSILQANADKLRSDFVRDNPDFVSSYACSSEAEFIAEAFAQYKLCSTPGKFAKMVGQIIETHAKRA